MAKTYIDVPAIGYKTWFITTGIIKDGKFAEDEENDLITDLRKRYPYSQKNSHVTRRPLCDCEFGECLLFGELGGIL